MQTPPSAPLAPPSRSFGRTLKRGFFYVLGAAVFVGAVIVFFLMTATYSEGYRVGTLQKISKKGVFFKSYEGELAQGFLDASSTSDAGVATRTFTFSVGANDRRTREQIDHAIAEGKKVKLFYEERYRTLPWVGDTRFVVTRVEEIH